MFTEKRGRGRPKGSTRKNKPDEPEGALKASNLRVGTGTMHPPAPKAEHKYSYTPLARTSLGNTELYHLFGIVIDATTPHVKKNLYRQLVKIIDPSMHYKFPKDPNDPTSGCVSVSFFSKDKDTLPTFTKLGDIIRIHRANIGNYKNYKTFSVNIAFGSSWVVFPGFPQPRKAVAGADVPGSPSTIIEPSSASSSNYTLAAQDADIVKKYREWLTEYFHTEFNFEATLYMNLNKVKELITGENDKKLMYPSPREYDLVVRVDAIADAPKD